MSTEALPARSRRAVLIGAAGAVAALATEAVIRPMPAAATASALLTETSNTANGATGLTSSQESASLSAALGVTATSKSSIVCGIWGQAMHPQASGVRGSSYDPIGRGVSGTSQFGVGVVGQSDGGSGVLGETMSGTGVRATAATGTALDVAGKARFSRCGKAAVLARHRSVDITVPGGLTSRSVVHATLQTYRSGVAIAAVRANFPSAGKARIYLTRVASTTAKTTVGWIVAEY